MRGVEPRPLARYATRAEGSRGRRHPEPPPRYRTEYQRDRDRVVHCAAFRRLEYKTQVFASHEGDMFRTRLTHSLEVAQIARSVARVLALHEDLTEAICLAHDLGHTPFGHAGQHALDACMRAHGGFEHNIQSLRVVDRLEERYAEFPGLNLTYETREGILKHCTPTRAARLGDVGERFLSARQPSLEAQLANVCDEIAYNHHDIDDGLRAGLLAIARLAELPPFAEPLREVTGRWPALSARRVIHEVIRRMIDRAVGDLIEETRARLAAADPADPEAVRAWPHPLVGFGAAAATRHAELKRFLAAHLYRHERVGAMAEEARRVVSGLFEAYSGDAGLLSPDALASVRAAESSGSPRRRARAIADYVAGMTDRFAQAEHARIFRTG